MIQYDIDSNLIEVDNEENMLITELNDNVAYTFIIGVCNMKEDKRDDVDITSNVLLYFPSDLKIPSVICMSNQLQSTCCLSMMLERHEDNYVNL